MRLEQLCLRIGETLHLHLQGETSQRYLLKLIGFMPAQSLLTTAPRKDQNILLLREQQPVTVKFAVNGTVCGFSTHVLASHTSPYAYLHLAVPEEIEAIEVRKAVRVSTKLRATISNRTQGSFTTSATVLDLSVGGARLEAPKPIGVPGEVLDITMTLGVGGKDQIVSADAVICSEVATTNDSGQVLRTYGVRFTSLEDLDAVVVHGFVYERILAGMNMGAGSALAP